ncbi:MAG TPA: glycosyltransferase family 1 protein [Steroidobacteraceae bacterium]|nr:glycosyltransferase family 1 protein [Steroidobacteraceae bacterium]
MRIVIVTDAWSPQTNGVVSTLRQTVACLGQFGHEVRVINPTLFRSTACPSYPEIRLALFPYRKLTRLLDEFQPEAIHIATEGPLGMSARRYCVSRGLRFTTSYHTQFPQYLRQRWPIPTAWSYRALRWFHGAATHCMVSTRTVREQLAERGFTNLVNWQRGVDTELFKPRDKSFLDLPRPIATYVGRVAIEKNIDAFLKMPWHGTKMVIGDGPELTRLKSQYPDAVYAGFRFGEDLARHLAAADVMVFPSLTDTFGLVNLEAMACGVPVAAFPVAGPIDVVDDGVTGALDQDLARAALRALTIDPQNCRDRALRSGWDMSSREFETNLVPAHGQRAPRGVVASGRRQTI